MKIVNKIAFLVTYNPKVLEDVGRLMSEMDLGIVGVEGPLYEEISWTTSTKIDEKYITKMKRAIRKLFKETKKGRIIKITRIV